MVLAPGRTNTWWLLDSAEDVWMESTDRSYLGRNLLAPISSSAGHKLVEFVRPGDLVLHYYQPTRQIVAYSIAEALPFESEVRWPDRDASPAQPAYEVPLAHFQFLEQPVSLEEIRAKESDIRRIREALVSLTHGGPMYLPFELSEKRPLRPAQGAYLTKMPRAVFDLFPELDEARGLQEAVLTLPGHPKSGTTAPPPRPPVGRPTKTGRQSDVRKKDAAERYAMERATHFLAELGYTVRDVSNQASLGYDLYAVRDGDDVGCEVKGSIGDRIAVDVQASEVDFAREVRGPTRSLLYVVDKIQLEERGGEIRGVDGRERPYWDWRPSDRAITPTAYRFMLPLREG